MDDQKKRPPPIRIPPRPYAVAVPIAPARTGEQQQQQQRNSHSASATASQGQKPVTTPLASPLEYDTGSLSRTGSERSKPETPQQTLVSLMEHAGIKPRNSGGASAAGSNMGSTTRSRHSERSQNSDAISQSPRGRGSGTTSRGMKELRRPNKLLNGKAASPSVRQADSTNDDNVLIEIHDLRTQCRAANGEETATRDEPTKSPKKKFMGMTLPALSLTTMKKSGNSKPPMPSKFAQVVGEEPRTVRHIPVRPIKPSGAFITPTKAPRSDTSASLPAKALDQDRYQYRNHSASARRRRGGQPKVMSRPNGGSSSRDKLPLGPFNNASFESKTPPTPPAKDTPPEKKSPAKPASPLRRSMPSESLREQYENPIKTDRPPVPGFSLGPLPKLSVRYDQDDMSAKFNKCDVNIYRGLLTQLPQPFDMPQPQQDPSKLPTLHQSPSVASQRAHNSMMSRPTSDPQVNGRSPCTTGDLHQSMHIPHHGRWSDDVHATGNYDGALQPRFYSPSTRSFAPFEEGESPSQNTNSHRYLCTIVRSGASVLSRESLSRDQINMVFQGHANDIDPNSSTGQLIHEVSSQIAATNMNDAARNSAQVPQFEPAQDPSVIQHQPELRQRPHGAPGLLQPDHSSSRLTDLLHGISPQRSGPDAFNFNCPSAVPSPLHNMPTPPMQAPPVMTPSSAGPWRGPLPPRTLDHHFIMFNEHLDVVGKTTWDAIEALKVQQNAALSDKSKLLQVNLEKRIEEVKMQLEPVTEKTDRITEQAHNIQTKLEQLSCYVKEEVMSAMALQEKKVEGLEQNIKGLVEIIQGMQKALEQKMAELDKAQHQTPAASGQAADTAVPSFGLPNHRSQPSLPGFYGGVSDSGRDGQQDFRYNGGIDIHNDPRAGYNGGYGQHWASRSGYHNRGSKEDRAYPGTTPYTYGSQAGSYYNGGYSSYNAPTGAPDQNGNGHAK